MKCPTPCSRCGKLVSLDRLAFLTGYCECDPFGTCDHGLCRRCAEEVGERTDDQLYTLNEDAYLEDDE